MEEEEDLHRGETLIGREVGKSNTWIKVIIACVTVIPDLKITISGRGAERLIEKLPEQVRTCITLLNPTNPDEIENKEL